MPQPVWKLDTVSLGRTPARLTDVSLEIGERRTAILGCSGAGKSSLLSLLATFEQPTTGTVRFHPQPNGNQLPLFWSPQDHGLWPHLNAAEHLAHVRPESPLIKRSLPEWLELVDLADLADVRPGRMSQGERSRLSLVRTLASEAWAMLFDEPLVHVDASRASNYWNVISETVAQLGGPLVYSTHDADSVLRVADDVICLSNSRVVYSGTVNELYFDPPDQQTAGLPGACNWFSPDDVSLPEPLRSQWPECVRPFELQVTGSSEGEFDVATVTRIGSLLELSLSHREMQSVIQITTTSSVPQLQPGEQVRLDFHPAADRHKRPA